MAGPPATRTHHSLPGCVCLFSYTITLIFTSLIISFIYTIYITLFSSLRSSPLCDISRSTGWGTGRHHTYLMGACLNSMISSLRRSFDMFIYHLKQLQTKINSNCFFHILPIGIGSRIREHNFLVKCTSDFKIFFRHITQLVGSWASQAGCGNSPGVAWQLYLRRAVESSRDIGSFLEVTLLPIRIGRRIFETFLTAETYRQTYATG